VGKRRTAETQRKRLERQKLRENTRKYEAAENRERERWKKRKAEGKIKKPVDLSRRQLKSFKEKRKPRNKIL